MIHSSETAAETRQEAAGSYFFGILRLCLVLIVLCGIAYPLASTGLAQLLMPSRANGSLLENEDGVAVGSGLIGQSFTDPRLFHGRVSSIAYKAEASGSNNYAPSNPDLLQRTEEFIAQWQKDNPGVALERLPVDLATNSGSGLDPHITPESALVQIPRISERTGIPSADLEALVDRYTEGRDLGLFGEKRVNVLKLNLALSARLAE
ncbi:MAG: potassium-transporting ATPase subunit [Paenibacillaceae bacterium]|jgi:K+-transporting ATPase ATPase C chain|nr:potassium-transporting ATPase subunit [Paenibacillaceae bacterium]